MSRCVNLVKLCATMLLDTQMIILNLYIGVMLGVNLMMIEQEQRAIRLVLWINLGLQTEIIGVYIMRRTGLNSRNSMLFLGLVTTANA